MRGNAPLQRLCKMARQSRKKRRFNSYSEMGSWLIVFVLLGLALQITGQTAARCDPSTIGSGSGDSPQDVCGANSMCLNNARCDCDPTYFSPTGTQTDCRSTSEADPRCSQYSTDCVYCGSRFEGPCQKCTGVLYQQQCLLRCPDGTQLVFQRLNISLSVGTCKGTATTQILQDWAIIVIIVFGLVVLIVFAVLVTAVACTCLRRSSIGQLDIADRTARASEEEEAAKENTAIENPATGDEVDYRNSTIEDYFESPDDYYDVSEEEKEEFFGRLASLRDQSQMFLKMLNDMRRRLKELPQNSPAAQQYRNVMRDLTRLLYMLNKKPDKVRIPPDGIQILTWSEQILNRYLSAQGKPTVSYTPVRSFSPTEDAQRFSVIGEAVETDF